MPPATGAPEGGPSEAATPVRASLGLRDAWAVAVIASAVALLFSGVVRGQEHLWGDFVTWYYPSHEYAAERLHKGRLPLWNPYLESGMPFLGEADHGMLYPPALLLHALVSDRASMFRALEIFTLLHMVWAGVSMFLLVRSLGCDRLPSLAAGLSFGLGAAFFARSAHVSLVTAQAWVPTVIGGGLHAVRSGYRWGFVLASAGLGLVGLTGSPASLVVTVVGLTIVVLVTALSHPESMAIWRRLVRGVFILGCLVAIGLLLAAVQLVPMIEFVQVSERTAYGYAETAEYSVTPASLVMLLLPRFYGWLEYDLLSYWGPNNFVELSGYAGLVALCLAPLAVRFRPWRQVGPWLAVTTVGLWLALGPYGGLHWLVWRYVPFIGMMRAPGRYLLLWALGLSALTGLGLQHLLSGDRRGDVSTGRWLGSTTVALFSVAAVVGLLVPTQLALLTDWKRAWFEHGWHRSLISFAATGIALFAIRRSRPGALVGAALIVAVVGDLAVQGRGIGLRAESAEVQELRTPSGGYETELLRSDPSLYRVRNRYGGSALLMLARLQCDSGPGRHVLDYQNYGARIASNYSPLLDLLNVKYLVLREMALAQEHTPNVIAQQYVWLTGSQSVALPIDPPLDFRGIDLVSAVGDAGETKHGELLGELELIGAGGRTRVQPIRFGIETGDVAVGGPIDAGREISVLWFSDVTDSGTQVRKHFLVHFDLEPMGVRRIVLRAKGTAVKLGFKELYLTGADPRQDSWQRGQSTDLGDGSVLNVYRNVDVLPRAFLVPRYRFVASQAEALDVLEAEGFDARREAAIERPPDVSQTSYMPMGASEPGTVEVTTYEPERIVVAATVNAPGAWLLLSEVHFPGWTATIDGVTAPILRADGLFRSVWLSDGSHEVVFRYQPRSFALGTALSLAGGVLLAGAAVAARRRAAPHA